MASRTKIEPTAKFVAVDQNGDEHTVTVYTTFVEYAPQSGPAQWIPGSKSHKLANGNHVNVNDDGTLEDVHTGRILRRK